MGRPAPGRPALTEHEQRLVAAVTAGDSRGLAKAITLVESTRADHRLSAERVLEALLPHTGQSIRVGISGAPGVGKSTFIEALGLYLVEQGHQLAVLAIDPSSQVTGGSILGDKTRMERLSRRPEVFIRPSPTSGVLGGVASSTRESLLLCEAAGFDIVIVETVGVGQSETTVAGMVDQFTLLQLPNAGDEIQGIKRGIVEVVDILVINKADTDKAAARLAQGQFTAALHLLKPASPNWTVPVLCASALHGQGIAEYWQAMIRHRDAAMARGDLETKRRRQAIDWMWGLVDEGLRRQFKYHPGVRKQLPKILAKIEAGELAPQQASRRLLAIASGS